MLTSVEKSSASSQKCIPARNYLGLNPLRQQAKLTEAGIISPLTNIPLGPVTVEELECDIINAKHKPYHEYPQTVQSGKCFSSKAFAERIQEKYPTVDNHIWQDYHIPYDLNDKQYHILIFDNALKRTKKEYVRMVDDFFEINPDLKQQINIDHKDPRTPRHHLKWVIMGLASKYKPEEINYFMKLRTMNNAKVSPLEKQIVKKHGQPQFRISDKTAQQILTEK